VGLAAAYSAHLLGAAVVFVGDLIPERLEQARSFGCETIDVSKGDPKDQIEQVLGIPEVDAAVDAVGFEARGHGSDADHEAPATVLNSIMTVTRAAGKLGIPGAVRDRRSRRGRRCGEGWLAVDSHRPRLGGVAVLHDGPMPGDEVPPWPDA
jgi:threonine dehydrogenase-like Zn-dependent dehydrogenase